MFSIASKFALVFAGPVAVVLLVADCSFADQAYGNNAPSLVTLDTAQHRIRVTRVATRLDHPWSVAFLPNGDILVTERPGRLRIIRNGVLDPTPIAGVPEVHSQLDGGLLDLAVHPQFAANHLVYFTYARAGTSGATVALARGRLDGVALEDVQDIFVADAWSTTDVHYGSRIVFDRDGILFMSIGERNERAPRC